MPQIVAALVAEGALAAAVPAAAATTAAAAVPAAAAATLPAATTAATTAAGASAAQTAALELAKQQAIQTGVQQAGQAAAGEAAKQGIAAAAQPGGASGGFGIMSDVPVGMGGEMLPAKAGMSLDQAQALNAQLATPATTPAPATTLPPAGAPFNPSFNPTAAPELTQNFLPKAPFNDPGTLARAASDSGISKLTSAPTDQLMGMQETAFPLAPKNALERGFESALKYAQDNPVSTGLGLMSVGQYLNKPDDGKSKGQYKNKVDMSGFKPSSPSVSPFKRSYEWQKFAVGGPVEQMSAMNAVGGNTMYPQSQLQVPAYSNPLVQRPIPTDVVMTTGDAGMNPFSDAPKYAAGGISETDANEYGLSTRKQRAIKGLSSAYEDMEKEREKQMAALRAMGDKEGSGGTIARSRTQQLSSPFSAAQEEHKRLSKKLKIPVAELPKTNLGDIDNYMDIPVEAANGGIMGNLGSYSDGGRLLKGPGDGVSDSIPAVIGKHQPARLADGEFVIPARIVSELGNGSTEAGARKLYAMMDRIQNTRKKSIGKKKVAVNSKADKHLPA